MRTATVSELRSHAEEYLDAVEQGEAIEVRRNGKPIALVSPLPAAKRNRWRTARPLELEAGVSLSQAILAERSDRR